MKIIEIAKYVEGLTQEEVLKKAKKMNCKLLTNKEIDQLFQSGEWEKYEDYFPCWAGTHVDYNGKNCTVTENGKSEKIKLPLRNDWYEQDKYGLPTGKESVNKPDTRYLWRIWKNSCLAVRDPDFYNEDYRFIDVSNKPSDRFGALGTSLKTEKK